MLGRVANLLDLVYQFLHLGFHLCWVCFRGLTSHLHADFDQFLTFDPLFMIFCDNRIVYICIFNDNIDRCIVIFYVFYFIFNLLFCLFVNFRVSKINGCVSKMFFV